MTISLDTYERRRALVLSINRHLRRAILVGSAANTIQKDLIKHGQRKLVELRRMFYGPIIH